MRKLTQKVKMMVYFIHLVYTLCKFYTKLIMFLHKVVLQVKYNFNRYSY